jgi:transcriptional regulator with XRE-family HTH domain
MNLDYKAIATFLRAKVESEGKLQTEIAKEIGISMSSLQRALKGQLKDIDPLMAICNFIGKSIYLFVK